MDFVSLNQGLETWRSLVKEPDNLYSQNFVKIGINKIIQTPGNTKCGCRSWAEYAHQHRL
jgi:hypothetical protein